MVSGQSGQVKQWSHLTKSGWSKPKYPITMPHPSNLALFWHKITLYRFNQGAHTIAGGWNWSSGMSPCPLTLTTGHGAVRKRSRKILMKFDVEMHCYLSFIPQKSTKNGVAVTFDRDGAWISSSASDLLHSLSFILSIGYQWNNNSLFMTQRHIIYSSRSNSLSATTTTTTLTPTGDYWVIMAMTTTTTYRVQLGMDNQLRQTTWMAE